LAVILDTSFLFALGIETDANHKRAKELNLELATGRCGMAFYTDFIIAELLTALRMRRVKEDSIEREGDRLIKDKEHVLAKTETLSENAYEIFKKYSRLSFFDAMIVAFAKEYNLTKIYSFDAGFDGVKGIERVF